jgi:hypothetical protein
MDTLDPIEFLGKIGIYKESRQFFKVQVTGVRQPDLAYLFLQLQVVGEFLAEVGKQDLVFRALDADEHASFGDFELGGAVDAMSISLDFVSVMYVGELMFSPDMIAKFEAQTLSVEDFG